MSQGQSKVLGPFEVINEVGPVGRVLVSIPYADVRGSQLVVVVVDNYGAKTEGFGDQEYWAAAEVEICASVQGVEMVLKRVFMRMLTGPISYVFDDAEAYDQVLLRARNLTAGRRGPPPDASIPPGEPVPTAANGFSITVQGQIQPRGGLGPKKRFEGMG